MAQIDDLNAALVTQTQSVGLLTQAATDVSDASTNLAARIAALPPSGGPDLSTQIAQVQENTASIDNARGAINSATTLLNSQLQ